MSYRETFNELEELLKAEVTEHVYRSGQLVDTPCIVLSPPTMEWEAVKSDPTSYTFAIGLLVDPGDGMVDSFWDLLDKVISVIEDKTIGVIRNAYTDSIGTNIGSFPAYVLEVDF
jgi:hypothetical protein